MKITKETVKRKIDQSLENFCGLKHRSYENEQGVGMVEVGSMTFSKSGRAFGIASRNYRVRLMSDELNIDGADAFDLYYYAKNRVEKASKKRVKDRVEDYFKDVQ